MADNDSGSEKTEQPTARRLSEARKEGQVARSQDFSSVVLLAAMTLALALAAAAAGGGSGRVRWAKNGK